MKITPWPNDSKRLCRRAKQLTIAHNFVPVEAVRVQEVKARTLKQQTDISFRFDKQRPTFILGKAHEKKHRLNALNCTYLTWKSDVGSISNSLAWKDVKIKSFDRVTVTCQVKTEVENNNINFTEHVIKLQVEWKLENLMLETKQRLWCTSQCTRPQSPDCCQFKWVHQFLDLDLKHIDQCSASASWCL